MPLCLGTLGQGGGEGDPSATVKLSLQDDKGEGYGLVVNLVGEMRWQQSDRQRDGRLDLQAEFLAVVVRSHQAVDLGRRRDLVFFVEDAAPVELRLNDTEVLDVKIVGGKELPRSRSE